MPRYIDAEKIDFTKISCCGYIDEQPIENIKKFIDAVPTADVKPVVHAHWEEEYIHIMGGKVLHRCECSECGYLADYATDYCPECGAKMDEEVTNDKPRKD